MPPVIASVVFGIGIAGLFFLARDRAARVSKALWIPVAWLLIVGSRPLPEWFGMRAGMDSAGTHNIEANSLNVTIFSLLLIAGMVVLFQRIERVGQIVLHNWPVVLFFLYCAVSTGWSEFPADALRKWIRSTGDIMMALIVLTEFDPASAFERLLGRVTFVLIPISVLLIKYYPALGRSYSNDWELMYTGVTDHKNTLGMICLVFGLGFVWRFAEHFSAKADPCRRRHLLADGLVLTMIVWLLRMAHSATSTSCFAMASTVLFVAWWRSRKRGKGIVHTTVVAAMAVSVFALFFDSGGGLIGILGRNSTLTGRTEIWQQVVDLARNPLIGTGFESFWVGDRLQKMWADNIGATLNEAHNGYIEVYLNLGWSGVVLLTALIWAAYRNATNALRTDKRLGPLKLAYVTTVIIYSLTEAGFRMLTPTWILLLFSSIKLPPAEIPPRCALARREVEDALCIDELGHLC